LHVKDLGKERKEEGRAGRRRGRRVGAREDLLG
jgi:hypothetical protein